MTQNLLAASIQFDAQCKIMYMCRGAGSYLWSHCSSGFYDCPSKEICQSFENSRKHAHNANITWVNRNMFHHHFCSDLKMFSSLLVIFNNSSEAIRTKGMKSQLCVILARTHFYNSVSLSRANRRVEKLFRKVTLTNRYTSVYPVNVSPLHTKNDRMKYY